MRSEGTAVAARVHGVEKAQLLERQNLNIVD